MADNFERLDSITFHIRFSVNMRHSSTPRGLADDGKRLPGDGRFVLMRKLSSEERCRRGDGSHVLTLPEAGG